MDFFKTPVEWGGEALKQKRTLFIYHSQVTRKTLSPGCTSVNIMVSYLIDEQESLSLFISDSSPTQPFTDSCFAEKSSLSSSFLSEILSYLIAGMITCSSL